MPVFIATSIAVVITVVLQNLVKLICDVKQMESAVMEMKYDANKAPLGMNFILMCISVSLGRIFVA